MYLIYGGRSEAEFLGRLFAPKGDFSGQKSAVQQRRYTFTESIFLLRIRHLDVHIPGTSFDPGAVERLRIWRVSSVKAWYEIYTNTLYTITLLIDQCRSVANLLRIFLFTAFFKLERRRGCYCGSEDKTMKQLYLDRWSNKTGSFPSVLLGKANSILFALYWAWDQSPEKQKMNQIFPH